MFDSTVFRANAFQKMNWILAFVLWFWFGIRGSRSCDAIDRWIYTYNNSYICNAFVSTLFGKIGNLEKNS